MKEILFFSENNHLYHTALGDFYRKNNQFDKAKKAYDLALKFAYLEAEKRVIKDKILKMNEV